MAIIKRKTVDGRRAQYEIRLQRLQNTMDGGGKWMYTIVDDTGSQFGDPLTDKARAKRQFEEVVADIQRGADDQSRTGAGMMNDDGNGGPLPW